VHKIAGALKQTIVYEVEITLRRAASPESRGIVRSLVTHGDARLAIFDEVQVRPNTGKTADAIVIDPGKTYQSILGFGAALTDAACCLINGLPREKRNRFLTEVFDPSGLGFNCCRICIGSSDYATKVYSYHDAGTDPSLGNFSIEHDRAYIMPIIKQARELNPDLFLLASPWSPPGWMKAGGSMLGGSMRRKYLASYSDYFEKFLNAYAELGIGVDAVTVQNEVDTDQEGLMPACIWTQGTESLFVTRHLGPKMAQRRTPTKIWILDHNYVLWGRVLSQLSDPLLKQLVDGVAWHGYEGHPSAMSIVQRAYPEKNMYWTEGGPEDLTAPSLTTNWVFWGSRFTAILKNWARCIIAWNLALDEHGRPNIGPFACAGLVTVDSGTKEIRPSGQYWALAHFSTAVQREAIRLQSQGGPRQISHIAFRNPDGSHALILSNAGKERIVPVILNREMQAEIRVPRDSMTTAVWRE
jgi:glucosylceramidase